MTRTARNAGMYMLWRTILVAVVAFVVATIGFFAIGLTVDGVLNGVGVPAIVSDWLPFLAGLGWVGLVAWQAWPPWPTRLGAIARHRGKGVSKGAGGEATTDDAAAVIEGLAGIRPSQPSGLERLVKPRMKRSTAEMLGGAVYTATPTADRRQDVLSAVDADAADVVERLLALYDRFEWPYEEEFLVAAIERFARDDPRGVEGYVESLFDVLDSDNEVAVKHAALTVGHLGRESPEAVDGAVERLRPHVTNGEPFPQVLIALGELAARDPEARRVLREVAIEEFDDPSNPTVFGVLVEIINHYSEADDPERDPYPGPDVLDEEEREQHQRKQEQKVRMALGNAMMGGGSGGEDKHPLLGYRCENCGAELFEYWDFEGVGYQEFDYACGNCGYNLDEPWIAGDVFEESWESWEAD